uniref:Uncharacterized protein n=1 Tax=Hyaloperonospora arabidopsidis (strain Emoy2) TaxID=559515 RepID=M4BP78_HYAAE
MHSPPLHCSVTHYRPIDTIQQQQQQQEQDSVHDQGHVAAGATAAAFTLHKQWDTKAASLLRGLEHVQNCCGPELCGSSLYRSTRQLLKTYATHSCPNKPVDNDGDSSLNCRVCKLWHFLMTKQRVHELDHARVQERRLDCRLKLVQLCQMMRFSVPRRRIIAGTVQNDAQNRMRRS